MDLIEESLVLKQLVINEDYFLKIVPFLDEKLFTNNSNKKLFKIIRLYIEKYNRRPSLSVLQVAMEKLKLSENEYTDLHNNLKYFSQHEDIDNEWMFNQTGEWIKARKFFDAIVLGADKYEKGELDAELSSRLDEALSLTFSNDIGMEFDEYEERWEKYNDVEIKIPFLLETFNTITAGGISPGTMNMLMSNNTGGCKSLTMCHFASDYIKQGKNVLYVSMEMAEDKILERIDANIINMEIDDMKALPKDDYSKLMKAGKEQVKGRLIVKQFPTSMAHVGHIRHLLRELKLKRKFVPDVIIIDYLSIMASMRLKSTEAGNSYGYNKAISEELRGLAIEYNVALWTAIQSNRGGADAGDSISMTDISESYGVNFGNDIMLAIITSPELDAAGLIKFKQLKNRYSDMNKKPIFNMNVSKPKMTLYDTNTTLTFNSNNDNFETDKAKDVMISSTRKSFGNINFL